jgi:hypothetical protein
MDFRIKGNFKNKTGGVDFNLPLITFKEDNVFFAYSPALDLSGYGNSEEKAKASFDETLTQFFDYTTNKKTFVKELEKLGWKVSKNKASSPPSLIDMVNRNQYLAEIFEEKQYSKSYKTINIPAFA